MENKGKLILFTRIKKKINIFKKKELNDVKVTYSMAQQPLKSFDRPLMKVSLSDSILVTLIFY